MFNFQNVMKQTFRSFYNRSEIELVLLLRYLDIIIKKDWKIRV